MPRLIYSTPVRLTSSALVYMGRCFLVSMLIGLDGVNDPTISVHDALDGDTPANEVVPSNTYDAGALGINGLVLQFAKDLKTGLYVKIANIGSGSVVVDYRSEESIKLYTFI